MSRDNNPFGPPSPEAVGTSERGLLPPISTNPFDPSLDTAEQKSNKKRNKKRNKKTNLRDIIRFPLSPNQDITPTNNDENTAYDYNTNHSRGAITLNDYEYAHRGNRLKYDYKKVDAELPKYLLWFRKSLYIAQMLVIAGGIIIACGAYVAENNGWEFSPNGLIFGHMEPELIYIPYTDAFLCFITAVIGFIGAKTRESCGKVMLIVYIVFLCICLIFAIASFTQAFADMGNVFHYSERQWDRLTAIEEKTFEWHNFCCNFDTIEPCCRFGYGVTDCVNEYFCFEIVAPHLRDQFTIIAVTSAIQSLNLLIITLAAMLLFCYMSFKTLRKKKKMTQRQQQSEMQNVR